MVGRICQNRIQEAEHAGITTKYGANQVWLAGLLMATNMVKPRFIVLVGCLEKEQCDTGTYCLNKSVQGSRKWNGGTGNNRSRFRCIYTRPWLATRLSDSSELCHRTNEVPKSQGHRPRCSDRKVAQPRGGLGVPGMLAVSQLRHKSLTSQHSDPDLNPDPVGLVMAKVVLGHLFFK